MQKPRRPVQRGLQTLPLFNKTTVATQLRRCNGWRTGMPAEDRDRDDGERNNHCCWPLFKVNSEVTAQ